MSLSQAQKLLKHYFGYDSFRSSQKDIIEAITGRKDTIGIMPTGGGKSLCYQIPALMHKGVTIVVSPLISLMKDQVDALTLAGIPTTCINSTLSSVELRKRLGSIAQGQFKLIYVAPERLESESFLNSISKCSVSLIAVDEAHCISQWGHDFRPSYRSIQGFTRRFSERPVVAAFTATAMPRVRKDIEEQLELQKPAVFVSGFDRPNLYFSVIRGENRRDFINRYVAKNKRLSGIIYAATRKEVDGIYSELIGMGFAAGRYHAGLGDSERREMQEAFLFDDIRVMVATNAFGMGIDKSNVRYVIHHNMPGNIESYYQEAGRAGRDGDPGECILLFNHRDISLQKFFINSSQSGEQIKESDFDKLNQMVDYVYTDSCLRSYILHYFGQKKGSLSCENCSSCLTDTELTDITVDAQMVISCVKRMDERFGINLVAQVLRGSKAAKIQDFGFEKLSTYGLMKDRTQSQIVDLITFLVSEKILSQSDDKHPVLSLTDLAWDVVRGQKSVMKRVVVEQEKELQQDETLFEKLRKLRRELAKEQGVPPYIIFSDKVLHEMERMKPRNLQEIKLVKGVGEHKAELYGLRFLDIILDHRADEDEHDHVSGFFRWQNRQKAKERSMKTHHNTFALYEQGKDVEEIAKVRALKKSIVEKHLIACASEGMLEWDEIFTDDDEIEVLRCAELIGTSSIKAFSSVISGDIDSFIVRAVLVKHGFLRQ